MNTNSVRLQAEAQLHALLVRDSRERSDATQARIRALLAKPTVRPPFSK